MSAPATKAEQPKAPVAADRSAAPQSRRATTALFDNRPAAAAQGQQQALINNSARLQQAATQQAQIAQSPRQQAAQRQAIAPAPANNTGLPDGLKASVEQLSGYSLDDVRVHYNSAQPAQLQAHAYAQGATIHVAPGQEQHLPHEAWHVVQQKQGRVQPTRQLKGRVAVNDDAGLEKEADKMGAQALQLKAQPGAIADASTRRVEISRATAPVQRVVFSEVADQLVPQAYYGLEIDGELVIAQFLGADEVPVHSYWFQNIHRKRKADKDWAKSSGNSRFYLRGSEEFEINKFDSPEAAIEKLGDSPQAAIERLGFAPYPINWGEQLADTRYPHDTWAYDKVADTSAKWTPVTSWQWLRTHKRIITTFSDLAVDLIVEGSAAYKFKNELLFLYEPDQTEGFRFEGDAGEIIHLLALYYAHLNKAAEPRSGKARAAADAESGSQRAPFAGEAEYSAALRAPNSQDGNTDIDKNTSISINSSDAGSKVVVRHTGPWKKGDRGAGQAAAMGGQNAKNYVVDQIQDKKGKSGDTLRQELGGRFEWLHVVGSSLGGINVQENLVAGSYDANTKMIALEHRVARWGTREYTGEHAPTPSKPLWITGESETYKNTRMGKSIKLTVKHGGQQVATGNYKVDDQTVITKSQYAAEEQRVDEEVKKNS